MERCLICRKVKAEYQRPHDKIELFVIPVWKWEKSRWTSSRSYHGQREGRGSDLGHYGSTDQEYVFYPNIGEHLGREVSVDLHIRGDCVARSSDINGFRPDVCFNSKF